MKAPPGARGAWCSPSPGEPHGHEHSAVARLPRRHGPCRSRPHHEPAAHGVTLHGRHDGYVHVQELFRHQEVLRCDAPVAQPQERVLLPAAAEHVGSPRRTATFTRGSRSTVSRALSSDGTKVSLRMFLPATSRMCTSAIPAADTSTATTSLTSPPIAGPARPVSTRAETAGTTTVCRPPRRPGSPRSPRHGSTTQPVSREPGPGPRAASPSAGSG